MQAIILAGGLGTRLRSVVGDAPKPMALINDKPFLAYLLDYLESQGITKIFLSVCYLREQIENYFGENYQGIKIDYVIENAPLGTGGAIALALSKLDSKEPVFVLNGDSFLALDYQKMWASHQINGLPITLALCHKSDCSRYGAVEINSQSQVTGFHEKGVQGEGWINAGVYLLQPDIFKKFLHPERFSFESDFLYPEIQSGKLKARGFQTEGYFIDIGVPEDYARACQAL